MDTRRDHSHAVLTVDDDAARSAGPTEPGAPLNPHEPRSVGPYALISRLGVGGMGTVYLARNRSGRRVAVKVIRPDLAADEEFRRRFRAEVEAARRVAPFCTAEVLDADPHAPAPYLVTEFIDGVRLDLQVEKGPLTSSTLTGLAVGVATALTAIHSAGLVHRDLKPSNVLLSLSGPRVIDFGIAQALEGAKARPTAWGFGSAGWMAPEQVHGQPIGPEADVFAWGILIAYAGTGRHPFGDGSDIDLGMRIVGSAPDLRGLPESLVGVVTAALAKHPDDRPSARELLLRLIAQPPSHAGAVDQALGQAEELLSRTGEVPRPAPTRVGPVTSAPARQPRWNDRSPAARPGQPPAVMPAPAPAAAQLPRGPQPRQPGQPGQPGQLGQPGQPGVGRIVPGTPVAARGQAGAAHSPSVAPGPGGGPVPGPQRDVRRTADPGMVQAPGAPMGPYPGRPAPAGQPGPRGPMGQPGGWAGPDAGRPGRGPGPIPSPTGMPYPPYAQPPSTRRPDRRLWWIGGVVVVALIAIALVIALPGRGDKGASGGHPAQTGTPAAVTTPPAATTSPSPSATASQGTTDGQFTFVVNSVDCGRDRLDGGILRARGKYCLVEVTVHNTGNSARLLDDTAQRLIDSEGTSYRANFQVSKNLVYPLLPGSTRQETLVFDIPRDATAEDVDLHESSNSPGVTLPLPNH